MQNEKSISKRTAAVHAGQRRDVVGTVNPIEPSSAYQYIDSGNQYYPRYFNTPNQNYVNEKLAALEQGESSILFGSGMAAVCATMMALLKPGEHAVLLENVYGGTLAFASQEFSEYGIQFDVAGGTVDALMDAVKPNTRVIFIETPANPLMQIVDLVELAAAAKKAGIITVVDNTFASPINQNPIALGIDVVLHSGTKYLGGHSDLSFGAVISSHDTVERIRQKAINFGANINSQTCYLIERSLKTLSVRVERQNENAMSVAKFLQQNEAISNVFYPGLPDHPGHDIAVKQMSGFGGMMSFELMGDGCPKNFLKDLQIVTPAMSLGGVESTVTMPVHTSHKPMSGEERARLGISDQLIRLSTGIEDAEDLIADFEAALAKHAQPSTANVS